jgi:uncharacterized membrane protein
MSPRSVATFASLIAMTLLVYAMIGARIVYSGNTTDVGLMWNLFLAWIPFIVAVALYYSYRRGAPRTPLVVGGLLWFLFFPNAPYLVTDLKYLRGTDGIVFVYESAVISAAAVAGLAFGFVSLYLMQAVVRRAFGAVNAWLFVLVTLALSSFGVYLGRIQRWNSWDVIARPEALCADLWRAAADPSDHVRAAELAVLFAAFLAGSYLVFYAFARRRNEPA